MKIGYEQHNTLKGIAIIGMMAWHIWGNPQWILPGNMYRSLLPEQLFVILGGFGNFCVCLFAFLTGYSLFVKEDSWKRVGYRMNKIWQLLRVYWVYEAVFCLIGVIIGGILPSIKELLYNLVGMGTAVGTSFVCVPFAWYIAFYIFAVISAPLTIYTVKKSCWLTLMITAIWVIICHYGQMLSNYGLGEFGDFFRRAGGCYVALTLGAIFSHHDLLVKIENVTINKVLRITLCVVSVTVIVILRLLNPSIMEPCWGFIYTIMLVMISLLMKLADVKILGKMLQQLGKHSMGMWLFSGIFFIVDGKLQKAAYFPVEPVLILIWVITVSYIVSFAVDTSIEKVISAKKQFVR